MSALPKLQIRSSAHDTARRRLPIKILRFTVIYLLLLSGCALPYPKAKIYEGTEISEASLQWLKPGVTNRSQVIEQLGAPNIEFTEQDAVAYLWNGQSGGILIIAPYSAETIPITMRRALLILFASDGTVVDYTFVGRPAEALSYNFETPSFDEPYDNWRYILAHWLEQREQKVGAPHPGLSHD